MPDTRKFDYIIIGAGSAGSILANRLSENLKVSVLVVEAGGSERHMLVSMPAAFIKTVDDPRFNWCFTTEQADSVNGRAIHFPRGKALGGSSAINGHLYVRGQAHDYDTWGQLGNRGCRTIMCCYISESPKIGQPVTTLFAGTRGLCTFPTCTSGTRCARRSSRARRTWDSARSRL